MRASCRCRWQATGPGSSLWCRHPAGPQAARTRGRHRRRPLPPPAAAGEQLRGAWLNEQLRRVGVCAALPAAGRSAGASEQGALGLGEQPAGRFQGAVRVCKQQLAARASTASPSKWRAPAHVCSFAGNTNGIMELDRSWEAYEGGRPAGARGDGRPAGGRQVPPPRRANGARYLEALLCAVPPVPGHLFSSEETQNRPESGTLKHNVCCQVYRTLSKHDMQHSLVLGKCLCLASRQAG